jgi:hypothetical protein
LEEWVVPSQENRKDLVGYYYTKIVKSLKYLEFSYSRVQKLPSDPAQLSNEQFEVWDGFTTRFARSSDIFLSKYIKATIKNDDPAFDGSFRDQLNRAEKLKLIDDARVWFEIRELRNVVVHEYSDEDLKAIFAKLIRFTPLILELRTRLAP